MALKSKRRKATAHAFEYLLQTSGRKPKKLQTDKGKEFYNKDFKRVLDLNDIKLYSNKGETKAAVVERFNRTFKEMTYRYMTALDTYKYLNALPSIVQQYNERVHTTTKLAPTDVTPELASVVWNRLYRKKVKKIQPFAFITGDLV